MATTSHRTRKASAKSRDPNAKSRSGGRARIQPDCADGESRSSGDFVKASSVSSSVDHPAHYNQGRLEVIAVIEDWQLDFHLGNAVKYIARSKHKGNELEDLKKAEWYLRRKIKNLH